MSDTQKPLVETHGAIEQMQPTLLEQVWGGFNELSKYGTMDEDEYNAQITDMNRPDLEAHARRVGVVIVESSERLRGKLLNEFRNYKFSLQRPAQPKGPQIVSAEVRKILAEGR